MSREDITRAIITEYERLESSPRWFHSFWGDLAEKEVSVADWVERSSHVALMSLGMMFGPLFAQAPTLAKQVDILLRQWFMRGLYMGMRKYTAELDFGSGVQTPLSDTKRKKMRSPEEGLTWSEAGECQPSDFDESLEDGDKKGEEESS